MEKWCFVDTLIRAIRFTVITILLQGSEKLNILLISFSEETKTWSLSDLEFNIFAFQRRI